ncbi:hypothetical protein AtNW77_Chr1g0030971 [Arabidopsis thaliana]
MRRLGSLDLLATGFFSDLEIRWCIAFVFLDLHFVVLGWALRRWSRGGGSPLLGLSFFCFPSFRWRLVRFWLLGSYRGRTTWFGFSDPIRLLRSWLLDRCVGD